MIASARAELHLHLEGSLSPQRLLRLSLSRGAPHGLVSLGDCERLYGFTDFAGFISAIKTASLHLETPADYATAVLGLGEQLHASGVDYAEVFWSVGILLWRGVEVLPYWEAIESARRRLEAERGVRIAWLFDAVRQFGPPHLAAVVDWACRLQSAEGSVLGIGIGGDERAGPAVWFQAEYRRASAAGLRLTAHAGETGDAAGVRAAWELLGVERIGHGLAAVGDPELCAALTRAGIGIDVCLTSNRRTGCWPETATHPLRRFLERGMRVSLSTDDPGIFGCTLSGEFELARTACGLDPAALEQLAANAIRASFLPEAEKARRLGRPAMLPGNPSRRR